MRRAKIILTIGGSLSVTWTNSQSTTWSSQTTTEHWIIVAAGPHKQIFQAVTEYGIDVQARGPYYTVRSDRVRIVDTSVDGSSTTSSVLAEDSPTVSTSGIQRSSAHAFYFHGPSLICEAIIVLLYFCMSRSSSLQRQFVPSVCIGSVVYSVN